MRYIYERSLVNRYCTCLQDNFSVKYCRSCQVDADSEIDDLEFKQRFEMNREPRPNDDNQKEMEEQLVKILPRSEDNNVKEQETVL